MLRNPRRIVGPLEAFVITLAAIVGLASFSSSPWGEMPGAVILSAVAAHVLFSIVIDWKRARWQFSLRTLLIAMTVTAVVLGLAVPFLRWW